ncbi:hypothetical protein R6Q57_030191 [Mikania cordata]
MEEAGNSEDNQRDAPIIKRCDRRVRENFPRLQVCKNGIPVILWSCKYLMQPESQDPSLRKLATTIPYLKFTAPTKSPKEILGTEEAQFSFRPPKSLSKAVSKRNPSKFCDFHGETGHHTNDCFQLKKRIDAAVKSGELAHLVKDIKGKKTVSDKADTTKDKGKKT